MAAFVEWHKVEVFALPCAMLQKHYVGLPDWWALLNPLLDLLASSLTLFANYLGVVLRGLAPFCMVWLIANSYLSECSVMCLL